MGKSPNFCAYFPPSSPGDSNLIITLGLKRCMFSVFSVRFSGTEHKDASTRWTGPQAYKPSLNADLGEPARGEDRRPTLPQTICQAFTITDSIACRPATWGREKMAATWCRVGISLLGGQPRPSACRGKGTQWDLVVWDWAVPRVHPSEDRGHGLG